MKKRAGKKNKPLMEENEVQQSNDPHIDQDFPGFPHHPSKKSNINPKTDAEKKTAGFLKKHK